MPRAFHWDANNTRKTLERVPDGKFDWKPHEKSTAMGALATHLSNLPICHGANRASAQLGVYLRLNDEWQVPTPWFVFESERYAGVRTAALLSQQTPEALAKIRAQIEKSMEGYARDGAFAIPMQPTLSPFLKGRVRQINRNLNHFARPSYRCLSCRPMISCAIAA